MYGNMLTI